MRGLRLDQRLQLTSGAGPVVLGGPGIVSVLDRVAWARPYAPGVPDDAAPTGAAWTTVLDLEQLRVEIRRGSGLPQVAQPWFEVRLHARSSPFSGTVESAWFADDLRALRSALAGLAGADDDVSFVVGGNRAAELRLTGGPSGEVHWLTARLTPNGDDPYPVLEMLLYERPERLISRLDGLDVLLEER